MKDFFKFMFATVAGIVVSCVLFFFIGILWLFSMLSSSESETHLQDNSVMMLDLRGDLAERSLDSSLEFLMGDTYTVYGLDDILASIQKAKESD